MKHYMPVKLFTGEGCIAGNAPAMARLGKKALIVCSPSAAKKSGALDDALSALRGQGIGCSIFDEITPNPSVNL
ncbi:MAG: iron-containing alcohol dehydrogenase, partial [Clostridia bacterium]|nr:iron-containing alcohol dehydrogenase [Clostridia bacterium]